MKQWLTSMYSWLAVLLLVVLLAMVGVGFYYLHKPIRKVVIVGRFEHLQSQCIEPILQGQQFKRFARNKHSALLLQAQAACPWLKDWRWKFAWSPTLIIYLTENMPQFVWNNSAYINQDHHIFAVKPNKQITEIKSLVTLSGDASQLPSILDLYDQAVPLLAAQQFTIASLSDSANAGYQLRLNNQLVLKLSQQQPLKELQRFAKVDGSLFDKPHKKIKSIDLRYPHGFAVQWKGKHI